MGRSRGVFARLRQYWGTRATVRWPVRTLRQDFQLAAARRVPDSTWRHLIALVPLRHGSRISPDRVTDSCYGFFDGHHGRASILDFLDTSIHHRGPFGVGGGKPASSEKAVPESPPAGFGTPVAFPTLAPAKEWSTVTVAVAPAEVAVNNDAARTTDAVIGLTVVSFSRSVQLRRSV
jgi:hypothetical protein